NGNVWALSFASNSNLHVGGQFTNIGFQNRNYLAALDPNNSGQAYLNWDPSPNSNVFSLAEAGATTFVGGTFSSIGGQARNGLAALYVTNGLARPWNPNSTNEVDALTLGVPVGG